MFPASEIFFLIQHKRPRIFKKNPIYQKTRTRDGVEETARMYECNYKTLTVATATVSYFANALLWGSSFQLDLMKHFNFGKTRVIDGAN